eukprot:s2990_g6.t1
MALVWVLRRILRVVGTVFFYLQKYSGMAPEAADVDYVGPATGAVPETSALRSFKRTGDQTKQVVVKRGTLTAVFNVGSDAQSIRTHGLYLPVEPDTLRGDSELVQHLKHVDQVHLCRNIACTEEGGEHFQEYGVVKKFNPERFQSAQVHGGALEAGRTLWSWVRAPEVGQGVHRLVGKIREYASESETEDAIHCMAGQIKWHGETGLECLAPTRCTGVGTVFTQILHDDVPAGSQEEPQTEIEDMDQGYEEDEENGITSAQNLLQEAVEAGANVRPKRRAPSGYAIGRDEGIREDQVRMELCRDHLMGTVEGVGQAKGKDSGSAPTSKRQPQESGEIRIAPPGLYKNDRKAGTGETTEPMEHIARAIQSQTAELATLVRHQAEGGGSHPAGILKGLNRQSEELVFLMRACGQYNIQVGAGEHGQSLANSLLAAQVGASTKLRSAGFRQKMTTRLAVGIAGPYYGTNEKYALSAPDFLSFTDAE